MGVRIFSNFFFFPKGIHPLWGRCISFFFLMTNANATYCQITGTAFQNVYDGEKFSPLSDAFRAVGYAKRHDRVPSINKGYGFNSESLMDVLAWLMQPSGTALWLAGPTGSGKTSLIEQVAARLNYPVASITCSGKTEFRDLVGSFGLVQQPGQSQPTMRFMHGMLPIAMRMGWILLLNEVDMMDPAELVGLNDILEGKPLSIPENQGELIKPHAMFRLVVTANSAGQGDDTGAYLGVRAQNIAALDRYRMVEVDYLNPAVEKAILLRNQIPEEVAILMVRFANDIRNGFKQGRFSLPMSTRVLLNWGKTMKVYKRISKNPLRKALEVHWASKLPEDEKAAICDVAIATFGESAWA